MAGTPATASAGVPGVVVTPNQCRNLLLPEISCCRATIEQQHLPCFDHGMARILLIEDDEDVRELIGQMLEDAGYSVSSAVDGEDGIVQFLHQPADLVLCDVFMPKKSGIAVLKELRRLGWGVPMIVMSGGTPSHIQTDVPEADLRGLAKLLGANATLAKPSRAPELISIIKRHLPGA